MKDEFITWDYVILFHSYDIMWNGLFQMCKCVIENENLISLFLELELFTFLVKT
jgi:hypothetical protein